MGDYHYFWKYVLLLDEVFKKFIDTCLKLYKLYLCHYFSSPGLSCNAILKMTGVKSKKKKKFRHWHALISLKRIERRNFLHC